MDENSGDLTKTQNVFDDYDNLDEFKNNVKHYEQRNTLIWQFWLYLSSMRYAFGRWYILSKKVCGLVFTQFKIVANNFIADGAFLF